MGNAQLPKKSYKNPAISRGKKNDNNNSNLSLAIPHPSLAFSAPVKYAAKNKKKQSKNYKGKKKREDTQGKYLSLVPAVRKVSLSLLNNVPSIQRKSSRYASPYLPQTTLRTACAASKVVLPSRKKKKNRAGLRSPVASSSRHPQHDSGLASQRRTDNRSRTREQYFSRRGKKVGTVKRSKFRFQKIKAEKRIKPRSNTPVPRTIVVIVADDNPKPDEKQKSKIASRKPWLRWSRCLFQKMPKT